MSNIEDTLSAGTSMSVAPYFKREKTDLQPSDIIIMVSSLNSSQLWAPRMI